ncbi:uncharacterized protein A4U43_C01F2070 [Asparagus officinalis]|uniref:Uncharacterized protein n=1 Tax=Asparagus officinalis TaxID=4686 RepID=A0A5P1FLK9_ASPOF|nr:F-box protein FBW2-like [Asparagus officinalis]XP_020271204.1 F-box protein FBW2-like [Asparagus officinalis]ONK79022.1 uncharacterized protein A4U43_C01F2070 [Asparagus officinalis]
MIGDAGFLYACSAGKFLRVLKIPMSVVTDQMIEKHAQFLPMLTVLGVSYCLKITSQGIEALGNCCKSLVELRRNMPPPNHMADQDNGVALDESEAMSIADTMHNIEHLELAYGRFSDHGLDAILSKCRGLRVLDLRGCWNCRLEGKTESKYSLTLIQSVRNPWEIDDEDPNSSDDDEENNEEEEEDDDDDSDIALVDVDTYEDYDDGDGYD